MRSYAEYKVVVLGESGVGKTSLVCMGVKGYYPGDGVRQPTIGPEVQMTFVTGY